MSTHASMTAVLPCGPSRVGSRLYGAHPALVVDIVDPEQLGRVQVSFPWLGSGSDSVKAWATQITPYADDDQGIQVLPEVGTQVVVLFEQGDLRRPYILGSTWNGRESRPSQPEAANNLRMWKTRSGSLLEFDDTAGAAKVTLSTQSGHSVVLDDGAQQVEISHSNGCRITITIDGKIEIQANQSVDVTAPMLNVHAAMSTFDGVVKCTTLIADVGVVSPSYTPGAGNVW
jgi:uncharacterized protein involved in type VI secretion and phage assembly